MLLGFYLPIRFPHYNLPRQKYPTYITNWYITLGLSFDARRRHATTCYSYGYLYIYIFLPPYTPAVPYSVHLYPKLLELLYVSCDRSTGL
jgi:hypothetical protein